MKIHDIQVTDAPSLFTVVQEINEQWQGQVWWRGQGNFDWLLTPSVYRVDRGYRAEQNIIIRFTQRAPSRHHSVPAQGDAFGWMFLMQHFRCPTRLLDWTESPLFATFFAVEDEKHVSTDGALFALNPHLLNGAQIDQVGLAMPHHPMARDAIRNAFDDGAADVDYVVAVLPSETEARMTVQLSVFTVHGSGLSLDSLPDSDDCLVKFRVPAMAKRDIQRHLKALGVRESNLFPDIEHLAKEVGGLYFRPPEMEGKLAPPEADVEGLTELSSRQVQVWPSDYTTST